MLIGITGGIATGKSLALGFFRKKGAIVFSADQAAHSLMYPGSKIVEKIADVFGRQALSNDSENHSGNDRKKLSKIVFNDERSRQKLNQITHPAILRLIRAQIDGVRVDFPPDTVVVVEVPLLYEANLASWFDLVIVVKASESVQIKRLKTRNSLDEKSALLRISSQLSLARKCEMADFVIENDGSEEDFERCLEGFWVSLHSVKTRAES